MAGGEGRGGAYASRFGRSSGSSGKTKRAIAGKMLGIGTYGHLLDQGARDKKKPPKTTKSTKSTKSTRSAGSGKKTTTSKAASKKAGSKAYSTGAFSSQKAAKSVGYKSNISSQRR